jgi:hypothetical protein
VNDLGNTAIETGHLWLLNRSSFPNRVIDYTSAVGDSFITIQGSLALPKILFAFSVVTSCNPESAGGIE